MCVRHEGARRDMPRRDIGVMQRVQHGPQHAAFELERGEHGLLLLRRPRMLLDVVEREIGVALGLGRPRRNRPVSRGVTNA